MVRHGVVQESRASKGKYYRFHAEQKWPWELTLRPEHEQAFMAGLEAFHDSGADCHPRRQDGVLHVANPSMIVSLFSLTQQFGAMGPAALQDPARAVHALLTDAAQAERGDVLHISDEWMGGAGDIDGMDKYKFTHAVMSATRGHGVQHEFAGGYADENHGFATIGVLGQNPQHVDQMYQQAYDVLGPRDRQPITTTLGAAREVMRANNPEYVAAFARAEADKSNYANTLTFCFRRVAEQYRAARPNMPNGGPEDVLSAVMTRMVEQGMPGHTWARQPSQDQHQLAVALLGSRG
ncbi:MAG TPA: hypothetical protein VGM10_17915 [Actinocrinis sp.]